MVVAVFLVKLDADVPPTQKSVRRKGLDAQNEFTGKFLIGQD
jgi:hypothetical protein